MKSLYYDIETCALPLEDLRKIMPELDENEVKTGNIKDPEKIRAKIEEAREGHEANFIDRAALKAISGKIIAVTFCEDELPAEMKLGDELTLIRHFRDRCNTAIHLGANIYGWNSNSFDLPFVCQRGAVHGLGLHGKFLSNWKGRFSWNEHFIDAKAVWMAAYSNDHSGSSLDTVCKALGLGGKIASGKDFAKLLVSDPAKAKQYAEEDVTKLRDVCRAMGI